MSLSTRVATAAVSGISILVTLGCAAPKRQQAEDGGPSPDSPSLNGSDSGTACNSQGDSVYTIDAGDSHLYVFDPPSKAFCDLGLLNCPTHGSITDPNPTPYSLGVDRNTMGWVMYTDAELMKVDINSQLSCTPTSWTVQGAGDLAALATFGMGFSTDTPGGDTDSLFVEGQTVNHDPMTLFDYRLATLDTGTMNPAMIAIEDMGRAELTGNSNGELWAFFADATPPHVAQVDKATGAFIKDFPEPALMQASPPGFAFAHWGGDYWVFAYTATQTTTVYQIDGTTGAVTSTTPNTGRNIVGAGVSTNAPIIF